MANVQDIMNEIDRIENAKGELAEAIGEKGVEVPAEAPIQQFPSYVRAIPTSIEEFYRCEYGVTTATEIADALSNNLFPIVFYQNRLYIYHSEQNGKIYFITILSKESYFVSVDESNDAWSNDSVELYEKPNEGIPDTDLSQAVQNAIALALTAYQKPDTGIPASDLAEGVIPAPEIFWATYGTTTAAEIDAAVAAGKAVKLIDTDHFFDYYGKGNTSYIFAFNYGQGSYYRYLNIQSGVWSKGSQTLESYNNKVKTLANLLANRTSEDKYPSAKATFDGLGKYGIVSQTQTWSGTGSNPRTYTMSNQVWGLIPQANIDLFTSAGATFNATTGYFELNGLTDISYEEMRNIYSVGQYEMSANNSYTYQGKRMRTIMPAITSGIVGNLVASAALPQIFFKSKIERVQFILNDGAPTYLQVSNISSAFNGCVYLREIPELWLTTTISSQSLSNTFSSCYSLEAVKLKNLGKDVSFSVSSLLDLASIVYMVDNAINTSAITITLHATAYARCQADTTEYTYNGQTYTGILAYASARNITIAS